jgi:hypothetical protein
LDYAGDTNRTASDVSALRNRPAYFISETGQVSENAPDGVNWFGFKIGTFTGEVELKQRSGGPGLWWAVVNLDNGINPTAIAAPAAVGSMTPVVALYAVGRVQSGYDVDVTFEVDAESNDPNQPVLDRHVSWTIDGTTYTGVGKEVTHTFAATGAGKAVAVTVLLDDGTTVTKNYTVTINSAAAPSAFA